MERSSNTKKTLRKRQISKQVGTARGHGDGLSVATVFQCIAENMARQMKAWSFDKILRPETEVRTPG